MPVAKIDGHDYPFQMTPLPPYLYEVGTEMRWLVTASGGVAPFEVSGATCEIGRERAVDVLRSIFTREATI